jgi:hydrogenase nickel incorporation protein HypB
MTQANVPIVQNILSANDRIAEQNRKLLDEKSIFTVNIMASPGAGKTSLILNTILELGSSKRIGVIEGDTAPVTIDADKMISVGAKAIQINTGGNCHLDAAMLEQAINQLDLDDLDIIIVENVGNLICPAAFNLGTHVNVVIASIPEGDDKPYKYPAIYRGIQALILNKIDLRPYMDFNQDYFLQGIKLLNPNVNFFPLSCKTKEGFSSWMDWLNIQLKNRKLQ